MAALEDGDADLILGHARPLFREYAGSLDIDLCFQGFDAELAALPGAYQPPDGDLLLALVNGQPAACGAFRALAANDYGSADYASPCEMKRLYVRPAFRGLGLGRLLADGLVARARQRGYGTMLLDTLDEMVAARSLYATLGFVEVPPYCYNPIASARYLKLDLM